MRMTQQRTAIRELLREREDFLSAQDIHALLQQRGASIGLATVYRNLQAMAESRIVDVLRKEGSDILLYRYCEDGGHHHHLVCRSCGRTVEVSMDAFEELTHTIAQEHGFTAIAHDLELYGLCAQCSQHIPQSDPSSGHRHEDHSAHADTHASYSRV